MLSAWTQHLQDPKEIERFKSSILGSRPVLERVTEIMESKLSELERSEISSKSYDNPGWALKQAHINGAKEYHYILDQLTNLDQGKI